MHPIKQTIRMIQRRARRVVLFDALALVLSVVLVSFVLVGVADYFLRLQDPGVRWFNSILILVIAVWAVRRFLVPAIGYRPSEISIARRIEEVYPGLANDLSSAMDFLEVPGEAETAGSTVLRDATIDRVARQLRETGQVNVVRRRWAAWSLFLFVVVITVVGGMGVAVPSATGRSVARLLVPWEPLAWPRRNNLEFVNAPTFIPTGDDLLLEVKDSNGRVPDRVELQLAPVGVSNETENEGQENSIKTIVMERDLLHGRAVYLLEDVTRSYRYRAVGGDDDSMPWRTLEVVEPPRVVTLGIHLVPPDYTALPEWDSPDKDLAGRIVALKGTRVGISGKTDRPIRAATLRFHSEEKTQVFNLEIEPGGRGFSLSTKANKAWVVEHGGSYSFELIDSEGNGFDATKDGSWKVRAVDDNPPLVSIIRPDEKMLLAPDARVPVEIRVQDDLQIRSVTMRVFISPEEGAGDASDENNILVETRIIFQGDIKPTRSRPTSEDGWHHEVREDYFEEIDLPQCDKAPGPGDFLLLELVAEDYLGQQSVSAVRRLPVVAPERLQEMIAHRREQLLGRLAAVLEEEKKALKRTRAIAVDFKTNSRVTQADLDTLKSIELTQRNIERGISEPDRGALAEVRRLTAELKMNRLDAPSVRRRMNALVAALDMIDSQLLPAVRQNLVEATREAAALVETVDDASAISPAPVPLESLLGHLQQTDKSQMAVIKKLEAILGQWTQWDEFRRFARDVAVLRIEQQNINLATANLAPLVTGKELAALSPRQRADMTALARQQRELARRFDILREGMTKMRTGTRDLARPVANTLDAALVIIRQSTLDQRMRLCAEHIEVNRIGNARGEQRQIDAALSRLLDVLSNRGTPSGETDPIVQVNEHLKQWRKKQSQLLNETAGLEKQRIDGTLSARAHRRGALDMATEQSALSQEVVGMCDNLTGSPVYAFALRQVATPMNKAAALIRRGKTDTPTQDQQEVALDRIVGLLSSIKAVITQRDPEGNNNDNVQQQDITPPDGDPQKKMISAVELELLLLMQKDLNARTQALDKARDAQGNLSPQQQIQAQRLADEQGQLAELLMKLQGLSPGKENSTP